VQRANHNLSVGTRLSTPAWLLLLELRYRCSLASERPLLTGSIPATRAARVWHAVHQKGILRAGCSCLDSRTIHSSHPSHSAQLLHMWLSAAARVEPAAGFAAVFGDTACVYECYKVNGCTGSCMQAAAWPLRISRTCLEQVTLVWQGARAARWACNAPAACFSGSSIKWLVFQLRCRVPGLLLAG
jgi:hypothetical protein